jgi:hypothetical protein
MEKVIKEGFNWIHGWITGEYFEPLGTITVGKWAYHVIAVHDVGTPRPAIKLSGGGAAWERLSGLGKVTSRP